MIQYTKATLKAHLTGWVESNGADADADFVAALDEIIGLGEVRLYRDLDLDSLDSSNDTTSATSSDEVFKPLNLISDRLVTINVAGQERLLLKRSRAWVAMMNTAGAVGTPQYYCEWDEDRWAVAPLSLAPYLITVQGIYQPASIVDGSDGNTTWFSTRMPDLLAGACSIEAAEFLKNWSRKAVAEAEYTAKLAGARGITQNLRRSDIEDMTAGRQNRQTPTQPPDPAANT